MKKIVRKVLGMVLALTLILSIIPLSGLFVTISKATTPEINLKTTVTTDKSSYGIFDSAKVTIELTNSGSVTAPNVTVTASSNDLKLMLNNGKAEMNDISVLPGETKTFSFQVILSSNCSKLNFFQKIIVFLKNLFIGTSNFPSVDYSDGRTVISKVETLIFDGIATELKVETLYSGLDNITDEELSEMEKVDNQVANLVNSSEFKALSLSAQRNELNEMFNELTGDDLVVNDSPVYDSSSKIYGFEYFNGVKGAVMLAPFDSELNGISNDSMGSLYQSTLNDNNTVLNTASLDMLDALVLFSFNGLSDDPKFREPFYADTESDWEANGLNTFVDKSATVRDFKNISSDYEVLCISGHGTQLDGVSLICLTEKYTNETAKEYSEDLKNEGVWVLQDYYGNKSYAITPLLFENSYDSNELDGLFVFSETCCFLGCNNREDQSFPNALLDCGVEAVVGFHNSVLAVYSREFMKLWVDSLLDGYSASQSFSKATDKYGRDDYEYLDIYYPQSYKDGAVATPKLFGDSDQKLQKENEIHTITYNANGGDVSQTSASVESGSSVTLPTPNKTYSLNYNSNGGQFGLSAVGVSAVCKGWSTSSSATSASYSCGAKYSPLKSVTLYAVWGSGTATISASKPTRSGYTFAGWSTSSSANSVQYNAGSTISISSDTTLYAVWSKNPNTYTVSYNANGGSGAPSSQTKTEGVALTLSTTKPTRTGYTFLGWSTSSSATSATYSAGGTYANNASVTLYAVWSQNKVTIPNLVGQNYSAARTTLQNLGLNVSVSWLSNYDYTKSYGEVASQSHSAGGQANVGSTVTLYVSKGPKPFAKNDMVEFVGGNTYGSVGGTATYRDASIVYLTGDVSGEYYGIKYVKSSNTRICWVHKSLLYQKTN